MSTPPLSEAEIIKAIEAYNQHGGAQGAADALNVTRSWVRRRINRAAERGLMGYKPVLPGYAIKSISSKSQDGIWVKQTKAPGDAFKVPDGHAVAGVSALTDGNGQLLAKWTKTKAEKSVHDIAADVKAAFADFEARAPFVAAPMATEADLATVYVCADWHIGAMAWERETGVNYDLKIAERTISAAVDRLVASSPASTQAVILGLGDLLHSDGYDNTTARSKNLLDVDGRYPKILQTATRLLIEVTERALQKHENVLVRVLPGNHDGESAIAVSLALAMYFSGNPRVTVDDDPSYFWWWSWGTTFIGATHGDQAKMRDLPLIMATRNAEAWGRSKFRHIMTGHVHHQSAIELSGVTVESFQTPTAPDAYHARMGYGSNRSLTSVTLHQSQGEIGRNKVNIV